MRIVFVRHGEPNYADDCLTDKGREQAAAAAERLAGEGISEIFASPCGRAAETAGYTARKLGLEVTTLDYMHEIKWGGPDVPQNGHPWTLGDWMMNEGFDFYGADWREHPYFRENIALQYCDLISANIDALLAGHGYIRDGLRYRCEGGADNTIALFSHGGSGACALAHILNLPFPYVASVMPYDFTSIIILKFAVSEGQYVFPKIELFNDCAHIQRSAGGPRLQQESE